MKDIEKLYTLYKQDVYVFLLSITHNPVLSEDLLQETFLKAIYSLPNFQGNSSVKTWLFGIARNLWLQSLRKERASVEYADLLKIYVSDTVENNMLAKHTVDRLQQLLEEKDERTRNIINLRVEGYSFSEISERVGISESSARVIDFRVKKWLKTILEKEELV